MAIAASKGRVDSGPATDVRMEAARTGLPHSVSLAGTARSGPTGARGSPFGGGTSFDREHSAHVHASACARPRPPETARHHEAGERDELLGEEARHHVELGAKRGRRVRLGFVACPLRRRGDGHEPEPRRGGQPRANGRGAGDEGEPEDEQGLRKCVNHEVFSARVGERVGLVLKREQVRRDHGPSMRPGRGRVLNAAATTCAVPRYPPGVLLPARDRKTTEAALFPPTFATMGIGAESAPHAHHAMHLVVARTGDVRVEVQGRAVRAPALVTAPDVPHALDAKGQAIVLVFVDPESDDGERLGAGIDAVRTFDEAARDAWIARLPELGPDRGPFDGWVREVVADAASRAGAGARAPRRVHPRVRRVVSHLKTCPSEADTSIAALALLAGLSESRLTHAFRDSVGIPLRAYLLWQKLQRAVLAMSSGRPLAHAAAEAGFADAAHMSRTFRRMLGMSASAIREGLVASRSSS